MTNLPPKPRKYEVGPQVPPLPKNLVQQMALLDTKMLGHIMFWGNMNMSIQANRGFAPKIVGRALTVQCPGPDSTMLHHAIGLAQQGDVLVIDRIGDNTYACLGDGVAEAARTAGIVAAIIDGPCTDSRELEEMEFPVWCRGTAPVTTRLLDMAGRANVPVSCGGVAVMPGDAILADSDGVYVLAAASAYKTTSIALERAAFFRSLRDVTTKTTTLGGRSGATEMVNRDQLER